MRDALMDSANAGKTLTCRNCHRDYEVHIDGKCPFEATMYEDMPLVELIELTTQRLKALGPGSSQKDYSEVYRKATRAM